MADSKIEPETKKSLGDRFKEMFSLVKMILPFVLVLIAIGLYFAAPIYNRIFFYSFTKPARSALTEIATQQGGGTPVAIDPKDFNKVADDLCKMMELNLLVSFGLMLLLGLLVGFVAKIIMLKIHTEQYEKQLNDVYEVGKNNVSEAFSLATQEADRIRKFLNQINVDDTYLLGDATNDLLDSRFTWVFGKLTYLLTEESDRFLIKALKDKKWQKSGDGIIFYVPETMADTLMRVVCNRIYFLAASNGIEMDDAIEAMSQAIIVFVSKNHDNFPIQIVLYSNLDNQKVDWNNDTAKKLLLGAAHCSPANNPSDVRSVSVTSNGVQSKLVAFLDDLVQSLSKKSRNNSSSQQVDEIGLKKSQKTNTEMKDLIGLCVKVEYDSNLLKALDTIAGDERNATTFGLLLQKCLNCGNIEQCIAEGIQFELCVSQKILTREEGIYLPGGEAINT